MLAEPKPTVADAQVLVIAVKLAVAVACAVGLLPASPAHSKQPIQDSLHPHEPLLIESQRASGRHRKHAVEGTDRVRRADSEVRRARPEHVKKPELEESSGASRRETHSTPSSIDGTEASCRLRDELEQLDAEATDDGADTTARHHLHTSARPRLESAAKPKQRTAKNRVQISREQNTTTRTGLATRGSDAPVLRIHGAARILPRTPLRHRTQLQQQPSVS